MVFEEFFLKKKIDLAQLKTAEPNLFAQFKNHFNLMGEKSFDHTKKYWFNKLRHTYPLSADEETRLKTLFAESKATPAEVKTEKPVEATSKPAGFRPKFKAETTSSEASQPPLPPKEIEENSEQTAEKPAFKPRFKAGTTSTGTEKTFLSGAEPPAQETPVQPSGFKPRFKPGITGKKEETTAKEENIPSAPPAEKKPDEQPTPSKSAGFKPRFKAGVTAAKAAPDPQEDLPPKEINNTSFGQTEESSADTIENTADPLSEETPKEATPSAKPTGFKPRFKAGITSAKTTTLPQEELPPKELNDTPVDQPEEKSAETTDGSATPTKESSSGADIQVTKPAGFKPRFKAGKTK